ncbi:hypothetical protein BJX63DRAFT_304643 [Aspergillus granulosus]|uniref:Uncharacterized protein n=1 Tax=Aspergillus granulosus TaxID=176169 RepID=A0ABR4H5T6_9EURO
MGSNTEQVKHLSQHWAIATHSLHSSLLLVNCSSLTFVPVIFYLHLSVYISAYIAVRWHQCKQSFAINWSQMEEIYTPYWILHRHLHTNRTYNAALAFDHKLNLSCLSLS